MNSALIPYHRDHFSTQRIAHSKVLLLYFPGTAEARERLLPLRACFFCFASVKFDLLRFDSSMSFSIVLFV